jgi:hypothetical protein
VIVIELTDEAGVVETVIESVDRIATSSADEGTVPPGHGELEVVEFQSPLPAVVTVAAQPIEAPMSVASNASSDSLRNAWRRFT